MIVGDATRYSHQGPVYPHTRPGKKTLSLDHSKQKETDTWDEVVRRLVILGSEDFSLPAGIAEGAEPRQRVVYSSKRKLESGIRRSRPA